MDNYRVHTFIYMLVHTGIHGHTHTLVFRHIHTHMISPPPYTYSTPIFVSTHAQLLNKHCQNHIFIHICTQEIHTCAHNHLPTHPSVFPETQVRTPSFLCSCPFLLLFFCLLSCPNFPGSSKPTAQYRNHTTTHLLSGRDPAGW